MDIYEQIFHNTNRKYYHGSGADCSYGNTLKPTKHRNDPEEEPMLWLTTNVLYAMDYVPWNEVLRKYHPNGRIYIMNLKSPSNILNIQ